MILVTGGTGLLGSHLLFDLVNSGIKVRAIKRKASDTNFVLKVFQYYSNNASELFSKIEWFEADISDYVTLQDSLAGIDKLYHCAAMISYNSRDRHRLFENNVHGTENIVDACINLNIKKLCHVSSIAAIGSPVSGDETDENTSWNFSMDNSGYSLSKYFAEQEVWRGIAEGLNAVIINPTIILGPGQWDRGSSLFFKKIWNGFNFYTRGVNGFVNVRDVARSMISLMESDLSSERFIVSSENITYKKLFEMIAGSLKVKAPKYEVTEKMSSIIWRLAEIARHIGFDPFITKEISVSSRKKTSFNNNKIIQNIGINFISIEETINHIGKIFLSEHNR